MKQVKDITMESPEASKEQRRAERAVHWPGTPLPVLDKEAMMGGFLDELGRLSQVDLVKLAAEVTTGEAVVALKRLKKLEAGKPTTGEISRGALVGAVTGPLATLAHRAITGPRARFPAALFPGKRAMLAAAGYGGIFGGVMPAARHKLEREVEKQKLREYLGQRPRGKMRGTVKKYLGV